MFIVALSKNPCTLYPGYLKEAERYLILDTDDCVVEKYTGKEILGFKDIEIANINAKKLNSISGIGNFRFSKLLKSEISCNESDKWIIKSNLSGNKLSLKVVNNSIWFLLNGSKNFAFIDFSSGITYLDNCTAWAERFGDCGIRIIQHMVFRMRQIEPSVDMNYYAYLYLLYKDGEFYVEKFAMPKPVFDSGKLKFYAECKAPKSVLAKLKLIPDYNFGEYVFVS